MNRHKGSQKKWENPTAWWQFLIGLLFCLGIVTILFPGHFFLQNSPMIGSAWSLQDFAVSPWTFIPGLKVLQYEIFNNGNFFWSNLKGLGMPLLGNEIQTAPMFPLTLALLWVPEAYFWNIFSTGRWLIFGSGAFLLAVHGLGLRRTGALVFVLSFVFALYHIRWLNHPFLNGIAAGTWYLYFLLLIIGKTGSSLSFSRMCGPILGLTVATYSVLTCGFPEGSLSIAVIAIIVGSVMGLKRLFSGFKGVTSIILALIFSHALALSLAAPQILSLIEFVQLSPLGYREGIGIAQIPTPPAIFFLKQLLWDGTTRGHPTLTNIFGLTSVFLFLVGLVSSFGRNKQFWWVFVSVTLCALFYLLKNFETIQYSVPIASMFNEFIGHLPIAEYMWWGLYGYPIFLIFFSFVAGHGADNLTRNSICSDTNPPRACWVTLVALSILVIALASTYSEVLLEKSLLTLLASSNKVRQISFVFLIFVISTFLVSLLYRTGKSRTVLSVIIILSVLIEIRLTMDHNRMPISKIRSLTNLEEISTDIEAALTSHGLNKHDYRFTDFGADGGNFGFLIPSGFATFLNGAGAIYTNRQKLFRQHAFGAGWAGYYPARGVMPLNGWERSAAGLFLVSKTERSVWPNETADLISFRGLRDGDLVNFGAIVKEVPLRRIRQEKHTVSCSDDNPESGNPQNVTFVTDIENPPGGMNWDITKIDVIRGDRFGHTTINHFSTLGVSTSGGASFVNSPDGSVQIALDDPKTKLLLIFCDDGGGNQYTARVVLNPEPRDDRYRQLGSSGIQLHLLASENPDDFFEHIFNLAKHHGGTEELINRHIPELRQAVLVSTSATDTLNHSLNFLKGVGVKKLYQVLPRELYLDTKALPRAYIPTHCDTARSLEDSLEQIRNQLFDIKGVVIEQPSPQTQKICENQSRSFERVQIDEDHGSMIKLGPVEGPAIVTLNDYFFPGWHAVDRITGEAIEIHPANLAFRALTLPEVRTYQITLTYRPRWLTAAQFSVTLGLMALALLFVLWTLGRIRA